MIFVVLLTRLITGGVVVLLKIPLDLIKEYIDSHRMEELEADYNHIEYPDTD